MNNVERPNLVQQKMDELMAQIELLRNSDNLDHLDQLLAVTQALTTCLQGDMAADYRIEEIWIRHTVDRKNEKSVKDKENKLSVFLLSSKGGSETISSLFLIGVQIGGMYYNVDPKTLKNIVNMAQQISGGFIQGLGSFAQVSQNFDNIRALPTDQEIERRKEILRDLQSTVQTAQSHSQEALRGSKETISTKSSNEMSIIRALAGH